jgi:hypothetical protein
VILFGGPTDRKAASPQGQHKDRINALRYPVFEPMIQVFERRKIFGVVDSTATIDGMINFSKRNGLFILEL